MSYMSYEESLAIGKYAYPETGEMIYSNFICVCSVQREQVWNKTELKDLQQG